MIGQEEEYGPVEQRTEYRFSIKELDGLSEDDWDGWIILTDKLG